MGGSIVCRSAWMNECSALRLFHPPRVPVPAHRSIARLLVDRSTYFCSRAIRSYSTISSLLACKTAAQGGRACGAPARPRTRQSRWRPCLGPHVCTARGGSPLAGRGCTGHKTLSAWPAREQNTGGGAYNGEEMRIARSDGGTRPSNRFPFRALQPNGGSTPAEASRLAVNYPRGRARAGVQVCERGQRGDRRRHAAREAVLEEVPAQQRARSHARVGRKTARRRRGVQDDQPGERRDACRDRAGEAVREQVPDHAR